MTSKKPEWFELTEDKSPSAGIRKINKKLPIATLVTAGAIILGGSIFATAQDEPSAVADTPVVSQSMAAAQIGTPAISNNANSAPAPTAQTLPSANISSSLNSLPMPVVSNVPQRGDDDREGKHDRGDRDHDDDDED
ncbi:hypothetical protein [Candidatus Planktophila dulcis]|uniref:hypothetical protein n=1 Tax=Candidatus Planktophila dulcis TaxID=1884914 RepID=UPI003CF6DDF4